jgi:hypothetical protein
MNAKQRQGIRSIETFDTDLATAIYRLIQWQNGIPWNLTKEKCK